MKKFEAIATPGHAPHHFSYLDAEGTLYAGDAAGMRTEPERFVLPPMAPPDVDVAAWQRTISELEARRPACLALTHFGLVADPLDHLATLRERLTDWEAAARQYEFGNGATASSVTPTMRLLWQNTSTGERSIWMMTGATWDGSSYSLLPTVSTAWSMALRPSSSWRQTSSVAFKPAGYVAMPS